MRRLVLLVALLAAPAAALPVGELSTASLDFGTVTVGQHADLSFVLRNRGDLPLTGALAESCAPFSLISGGGAYSLAAGDSVVCTVRFTPLQNGAYTCAVFTSSCRCGDVALSGVATGGGSPAFCTITPTSLNFGTVAPGTTVDRTFRVTNSGGSNLGGTVTEGCSAYSILSGATYSLAGGQFQDVTIRFTAPSDGTYPCVIDTGNLTCADVSCTGTSLTPSPVCLVTPTSLNFGTAAPDSAVDRSFTIQNTGGGTLSGTVSEACAGYSIVSGGGAYALNAGQSKTITVRLQTSAGGQANCSVSTGGSCAAVSCSGFIQLPGTDLLPTDLTYLGAFKFSSSLLNEGGGRGMGVLANGNLIICGTDNQWGNAAVVAPATPVIAGSVGALNTATTVTSITDITGGIFGSGDPLVVRWEDIVVMDDRLVLLKYPWYDRNYNNDPGLGFCNLSYGSPTGPFYVGANHAEANGGIPQCRSIWYQGKIAGYGTQIPAAYVEGGRTLAIGRVRYEYGEDISAGPAVYFLDPDDPLGAVVALCYDQAGVVGTNNPGPHSRPDYSLTNQVTDMAWVGSTVLFAESYCPYASHYGQPGQSGELGDMGACVESNAGYVCGHQGDPLPAYNVQLSFYHASDLMAASRGEVNHWSPQPYATLNLYDEMINPPCQFSLGGMGYDEGSGKLYVLQRSADTNNRPICHVWQITAP